MDSEEFYDVIKNTEVAKENIDFKLYQLKVEYFYWNSESISESMPISSSVELVSNYNYENDKLEWKKIISNKYLNSDNSSDYVIDSYEDRVEDIDVLINNLEKIDLRNLKNNYFTDKEPELFTHWEITYNNYFKIVGTIDQSIDEYVKISDILGLKDIVKDTLKNNDKIGDENGID